MNTRKGVIITFLWNSTEPTRESLLQMGEYRYHLVDKKLPDVINANCWAHARLCRCNQGS
ncbi:MAG: hypothetical protein KH020_08665 [Clostridiales bacterium]|nr:hypothetical protein [Clostridiales bacterium]